jgi:hypothetical protein
LLAANDSWYYHFLLWIMGLEVVDDLYAIELFVQIKALQMYV